MHNWRKDKHRTRMPQKAYSVTHSTTTTASTTTVNHNIVQSLLDTLYSKPIIASSCYISFSLPCKQYTLPPETTADSVGLAHVENTFSPLFYRISLDVFVSGIFLDENWVNFSLILFTLFWLIIELAEHNSGTCKVSAILLVCSCPQVCHHHHTSTDFI